MKPEDRFEQVLALLKHTDLTNSRLHEIRANMTTYGGREETLSFEAFVGGIKMRVSVSIEDHDFHRRHLMIGRPEFIEKPKKIDLAIEDMMKDPFQFFEEEAEKPKREKRIKAAEKKAKADAEADERKQFLDELKKI